MIEAREASSASSRCYVESLSAGFIHYPPPVLGDAYPALEDPAHRAAQVEGTRSRRIAVRRGPGRAIPSRIAVPDF